MRFQLGARTDAGRDIVSLAERLAADFAGRAADHDREASYPFENVRPSGRPATWPPPCRASSADWGWSRSTTLLVASSRLARGDAAVTIGLSMHLIPVVSMADSRRGLRGIAEAAHDGVVEGLASRTGFVDSPRAQTLAAENAIEAAVRVVRALALSGGAGYMSRHPLSRAYRDVRAGAFMHPLGANRAYEFIGRVVLGAEAALR